MTETWLFGGINDSELFDSSFNVYRRDRHSDPSINTVGGGILIAVKSCFVTSLVNVPVCLNEEFLCVKMVLPHKNIYLVTMYIVPGSPVDTYNEAFSFLNYIFEIMSYNDEVICLGDFNLTNVSWKRCPDTYAMVPTGNLSMDDSQTLDSLTSLGLHQINDITNSNAKILDLIYTTIDAGISLDRSTDPLVNEDSHHPALTISIQNFEMNNQDPDNVFKFNFKKTDYTKLNNLLSLIDWSCLCSCSDIDSMVLKFYDKIFDCFLASVPLISIKSKSLAPSWYDSEVRKLKNRRNKLWFKYKQTGLVTDFNIYCEARNIFNRESSIKYLYYIQKVQSNLKMDPKSFWNFINSKRKSSPYPSVLMHNNISEHDPRIITQLFSDFFQSAYICDSSNCDNYSNCDNLNCDNLDENDQLFGHLKSYSHLTDINFHITIDDIMKFIAKLEDNDASGPDGVPASVLKKCVNNLSMPLSILFNCSLSTCKFPHVWKQSFIIPLHKKGKKDQIINYRPIAKLSAIPKLFEAIVCKTLSFYTKSFIVHNQHGFSKGRSTVTLLTELVEFCVDSFKNKKQTDCVLTDFSKAFDKLSHRVLLNKMSRLGFSVKFIAWLKSYLFDRSYSVNFNGYHSNSFVVNSGVPQGSHLGPVLFILFVNDLPSVLKYSNCLMYADDVNIFKTISSNLDCEKLQIDLNAFYNWCARNRLLLNIDKCKIINFSRKLSVLSFDYSFNGVNLLNVNDVSILGVLFDKKLEFTQHINMTCNKANSILGWIKRESRQFSDPYVIKQLFTTFVRPIIEYACQVWTPYYSCHKIRIEQIQKRFLKFALRGLGWQNPLNLPSYSSRLKLIDLPSLERRRSYLCFVFIVNLIDGNIDALNLLSRVNFNVPNRNLRGFRDPIYIKHYRTNYEQNSPLNNMFNLYNVNHNLLINFSDVSNNGFKEIFYNIV